MNQDTIHAKLTASTNCSIKSGVKKSRRDLAHVPGALTRVGLDLLLESPIGLPKIVQKGEIAEPRDLHLIQVVQPAGPRQTSADGRLVQERFQHACDIRAVIDQRVPGRAASTLIAKLAPEVADAGPTLHRPLRQICADAHGGPPADGRSRPSTRRGHADARATAASRRGGWSSGRNSGACGPRRINRLSICLEPNKTSEYGNPLAPTAATATSAETAKGTISPLGHRARSGARAQAPDATPF
jgi:hypothetical protein